MKNPKQEDLETGAAQCELFCEIFPMKFPNHTISRKMHVLSCVVPHYVRQGVVFRYLKIEQKTENLHAIYNELERQFANVRNIAHRYFLMLKAYENKLKTDMSAFKK